MSETEDAGRESEARASNHNPFPEHSELPALGSMWLLTEKLMPFLLNSTLERFLPCIFPDAFCSTLSFWLQGCPLAEMCCWPVWHWLFELLISAYCPGAAEGWKHTTITGTGATHVSFPSRHHSNGRNLGQFHAASGHSDFPISAKSFDHPPVEIAGVLWSSPREQWHNPLSSFLAALFLEHCFWFQHFITGKTLMNYSEWRRE